MIMMSGEWVSSQKKHQLKSQHCPDFDFANTEINESQRVKLIHYLSDAFVSVYPVHWHRHNSTRSSNRHADRKAAGTCLT